MKGKTGSKLAAGAGRWDVEWGRKWGDVWVGQRVGVLERRREY